MESTIHKAQIREMLRVATRSIIKSQSTRTYTQSAASTMTNKALEHVPPPVHRGMTTLDKKAFVTHFTRLGVRIESTDATKVTKAKEMRP